MVMETSGDGRTDGVIAEESADVSSFDAVREALPNPERIPVGDAVEVEALHLPGPDPTLVFLHGGFGSLWDAYPQLAALEGDVGLLAYSLAGNRGSSDRPEHTLSGHVADLRGLLEALDIRRPLLHGHSYGSALAIEYAKRHRVAGLALAGGADHNLTASFERPLLALLRGLRLYRLPIPDTLFARLVHSATCHPSTPRAVAAEFVAASPLPERRSAYVVQRAFRDFDARDAVTRIDAPALVAHGLADEFVPVDRARGTAERLPRGTFLGFDRSGHLPFLEQPTRYEWALRALLRAVRTDRSIDAALSAMVSSATSGGH